MSDSQRGLLLLPVMSRMQLIAKSFLTALGK
jgi:hypothetical protein